MAEMSQHPLPTILRTDELKRSQASLQSKGKQNSRSKTIEQEQDLITQLFYDKNTREYEGKKEFFRTQPEMVRRRLERKRGREARRKAEDEYKFNFFDELCRKQKIQQVNPDMQVTPNLIRQMILEWQFKR